MTSITIGRDNSCDVILNDPQVSRVHASIMKSGQGYLYKDMSTNGTVIKGVTVRQRDAFIQYGEPVYLAGRVSLPWEKIRIMFPEETLYSVGGFDNRGTEISSGQVYFPSINNANGYNNLNIRQPYSVAPVVKRPKNYKVASILVLIFCGIIWGAIGYSYAAKVDKLYDDGEFKKAEEYSSKARMWCVIGVVIFIFWLFIRVAYLIDG